MSKRNKTEIRDMVKDELLELSKVTDVSESMRKFDKMNRKDESTEPR